jgi:hypothetical protein
LPSTKNNGGQRAMLTAADDDFAAIEQIVETLKHFSSKDQQRILRGAAEKLGLADTHAMATAPVSITDFNRTLLEHKQSNNRVFAAAVAYAHEFSAPPGFSRKFITPDDLDTAARQIGRNATNYPGQTLINAAQSGLLKKIMHGKYALTAKGRRAVEPSDKGRRATAAKRHVHRRPKSQRLIG